MNDESGRQKKREEVGAIETELGESQLETPAELTSLNDKVCMHGTYQPV